MGNLNLVLTIFLWKQNELSAERRKDASNDTLNNENKMTRLDNLFMGDPWKSQKETHQTTEDSCFSAWQAEGSRGGNPLLDSGK